MKQLSNNAKIVMERFLAKDKEGRTVENAEGMFKRVAKSIAIIDKKYKEDWKKSEKEFLRAMEELEFLPSIPVLANAGKRFGQLGACFVLPISDDLGEIFEAVKEMALIQASGGGTGFSFSRLRPEGSFISSTGGIASGPVSFMKVFDSATGAIKEGGIRRGANIGILSVEHPDIEKFINAKRNTGLSNFNISVAITDNFMKALENNENYFLINPHTRKKIPKRASEIFEIICENAHSNGEPGVIFIDRINKFNPILNEEIEATNPCSEVPLLPYESCILGSINLSALVKDGKMDYKRLSELIERGVHFLDNCIDASRFPIEKISKKVLENRKIGLGIMGFADYLIKRGIAYNSEDGIREAGKIGGFLKDKSKEASAALAKKRGNFLNIKNSIYEGKKMRNATVSAIAPTGTIGIIADCSDGIEPLFNVIYERHTNVQTITEINPLFKEIARKFKLSEKDLREIAIRGIKKSALPSDIKRVFVSAHEIDVEYHIKMQAEFQKYIDNAISKTVNLPYGSSIADVKKAFFLAYKLGCKGVSVYRDKSRDKQVLDVCERCMI